MLISVILFLVGLALIIFGADYLVDGASAVARKAGISEFVIGLTIVGMGTSAPEMVVSFLGALEGNADIAVGNVMGSNIFNTLLILGLTAVLMPMAITPGNRRKDIPFNIAVTVLLLLLVLKNFYLGGAMKLGRGDGALLLAVFVGYMILSFRSGKAEETEDKEEKVIRTFPAILMIAGGLAGLIVGGRLFVDNATDIARQLGISDKFIAITILAGGTSMPELATCVVAAIKKKGQLALGNILGSNVFNILLILGGSALITPLSFASIDPVDMGVLVLSAVMLLTAVFTGKKNVLDRFDGALLLLVEAAYLVWLFMKL